MTSEQRVAIRERDHPWFGFSGTIIRAFRGSAVAASGEWYEVRLDNGCACAVPVDGVEFG